jgi:hypothetical protein
MNNLKKTFQFINKSFLCTEIFIYTFKITRIILQ